MYELQHDVASIRFDPNTNVFRFRMRSSGLIPEFEMRTVMDIRRALCPKDCRVIAVLPSFSLLDHALARQRYFDVSEFHQPPLALAVVTLSVVNASLVNLYLTVHALPFPVKLFIDEASANSWLLKQQPLALYQCAS